MTPLHRIPVLLLVVSALAVFSGCARKKPVVVVVPQEQPPTTAPTPTPTPEAKTEPQPSEPGAQPAAPGQPTTEANKTADKTAKNSHGRPHGQVKKPSPVVKADATPPEPKPAEPRSTPAPISPSISPGDAARDESSTEQLLQTAENTVNGIKRQLSQEEEGIVAKIRSFINQSRQATKDNDPARAHLLAQKANLLSNELVRQR